MQVPNFILILGNRRNLIFRVSIVVIVGLFYVALHYSGNSAPEAEWVPITVDGSERTAETRYLKDKEREMTANFTDANMRKLTEFTSQKIAVTTMSTVNKTASSTASDVEKNVSAVPSEANILDEEPYDENVLTNSTLMALKAILGCKDKDFFPETLQRGEYWVLKNYVRANHGPVQCYETITATTHCGFEFLDNLVPLVERWMAPISLAIHAPGTDMLPSVNSIRYLRDCSGHDLVQQFVTFHIFFSNKHIPENIPNADELLKTPYDCALPAPYAVNSSSTYKEKMNLLYPVNVGRNIARAAALTHFLLPLDIELYPSPFLVPQFLNMIARNEPPLSTSNKPRVFPLSLFEIDKQYSPPQTKLELQGMLKNKTAIPFHKYVCPTCHNIPRGNEWMAKPETPLMEVFYVGKREKKYSHWEPIFIGTHADAYYDDRLSWEGKKDKMTQAYIFCAKDYEFMILSNAFLVHKPGIKYYKANPKRDKYAAKQGSFVNNVIKKELKKIFGSKPGCVL
ncbi:beta-1,4-glucuronyltransferase 1-like [Spodoptera litura]|uniref:Beta-1,4-glucuronyltransferase 1-like n=1 Tax=Spodoptera litura TaxID=69820 RepID=A0A9J7E5D8_SPOLT|nr:beta-1,4-glucuronyltransferase 1-like [Spodoptera litura]